MESKPGLTVCPPSSIPADVREQYNSDEAGENTELHPQGRRRVWARSAGATLREYTETALFKRAAVTCVFD